MNGRSAHRLRNMRKTIPESALSCIRLSRESILLSRQPRASIFPIAVTEPRPSAHKNSREFSRLSRDPLPQLLFSLDEHFSRAALRDHNVDNLTNLRTCSWHLGLSVPASSADLPVDDGRVSILICSRRGFPSRCRFRLSPQRGQKRWRDDPAMIPRTLLCDLGDPHRPASGLSTAKPSRNRDTDV